MLFMNRLFSMPRSSQHLSILFAMLVMAAPASAAEEEQTPTEIAYYALKPSFVSNLSGGPKYIRCDIQLMTEEASEIPKIELHTPALRHDILMLIGGRDGNQLKTREGKEDLRQTALASVRSRLEEMTGKAIVNDLYFTAYYVK
jgi:flagellar FliL protein